MCAKKILIGELTKIDSGQFVCPSCRKQFRRSLAYKTGEAIRSIKK
jgi:transposase-like protein